MASSGRESLVIRPPFERNIRPLQHLPAFITAANPNVVVWGDSRGTPADQIASTDYLSQQVKRKLVREYPGKTINFVERSIPGGSWSSADAASLSASGLSQLPTWAAPTSNSWASFIQAQNPDLIVFIFGANTGTPATELAAFMSVMSKVTAMSSALGKAIDVLFFTSEKPNAAYGSLTGTANQEARDQQAAVVRGWCMRNNKGFFDVNRLANIVRDGVDPVRTTFYREATSLGPALPWSYSTKQAHDMALRFQTVAALATAMRGGTPFRVNIGSLTDNAIEFWQDSGTGNFFVNVRLTGSILPVSNFNTGVAVGGSGSATLYFEVIVKGNWVQLGYSTSAAVQGSYTSIWSGFVERSGGLFSPGTAMTGQAGQVPFINSLHLGADSTYVPLLTDAEIFGIVPSGSGGSIELYGGNGTNHLSSWGQMLLYGAIMDHESLAA